MHRAVLQMEWWLFVLMQQQIQPPIQEHLVIIMMDFGEDSQMIHPSKHHNPIWTYLDKAIASGNKNWIKDTIEIIQKFETELENNEEYWQDSELVKHLVTRDNNG